MTDGDTILVADDSEDDVMLLKLALEKANLCKSVHTVSDGEEAIAYLQGSSQYADRSQFPLPAILLLDLKMPRKGGFEVLTWVRSQNGLGYLPVFIFTASMRQEDVQRAYELGADGFLVKPGAMDKLGEITRSLRDWLACNQFPAARR